MRTSSTLEYGIEAEYRTQLVARTEPTEKGTESVTQGEHLEEHTPRNFYNPSARLMHVTRVIRIIAFTFTSIVSVPIKVSCKTLSSSLAAQSRRSRSSFTHVPVTIIRIVPLIYCFFTPRYNNCSPHLLLFHCQV